MLFLERNSWRLATYARCVWKNMDEICIHIQAYNTMHQ